MNNTALKQEQFVESVELRNKFVKKIGVLDKVKVLSLLPDSEYLTTRQIADYYEVDEVTIRQIVTRHNDEMICDGFKTLRGQELKDFKQKIALHNVTLSAKSNMALFNRRCCLRIGMLLRDSEVAKQVRTYLLDVEDQATPEQKRKATRGSSWDGKDLILYDIIITTVNNGGTLTDACKIASGKLNKTVAACMNRYSSHIKKMIQNEDLKSRIQRGRSGQIQNTTNDTLTLEYIKQYIDSNTEMFKQRLQSLEEECDKKDNRIKRLISDKRKLQDELISTQAVIRAALKIQINEEVKNTFRMDSNGNLERI